MDAHHIPCTHHAARRHIFAKSSEQIGFLRSTISYFNVFFLAAEIRSPLVTSRNSTRFTLFQLFENLLNGIAQIESFDEMDEYPLLAWRHHGPYALGIRGRYVGIIRRADLPFLLFVR